MKFVNYVQAKNNEWSLIGSTWKWVTGFLKGLTRGIAELIRTSPPDSST